MDVNHFETICLPKLYYKGDPHSEQARNADFIIDKFGSLSLKGQKMVLLCSWDTVLNNQFPCTVQFNCKNGGNASIIRASKTGLKMQWNKSGN